MLGMIHVQLLFEKKNWLLDYKLIDLLGREIVGSRAQQFWRWLFWLLEKVKSQVVHHENIPI